MRGLREYYLTRNKREKALIWVVISIAGFVLFYYLDFMSAFSNAALDSELKEKATLLRKLQALISREKLIKTEASSSKPWGGIRLIKATYEGQVLTEIPRLLKKISAQNGLVLSKSDVTQKEALCNDPLLLKLEMAIEIEAIPKAEKLQKFLYQLENDEDFFCQVKELKLKKLDNAEGVHLSATIDTFALINR
ncbi:MAG TPA: hypothetical protein ACFYD3_02865 [Candidatus Hypogeohydataceae bacterium YC41]